MFIAELLATISSTLYKKAPFDRNIIEMTSGKPRILWHNAYIIRTQNYRPPMVMS